MKKEITIQELINLYFELNRLKKRSFGSKVGFFITKNIRKTKGDFNDYLEQEKALVTSDGGVGIKIKKVPKNLLAEFDAKMKEIKGEEEIAELREKYEVDDWEIPDENNDRFKEEVKDLQLEKVTIDFHTVLESSFREKDDITGEDFEICFSLGLILDDSNKLKLV